MRLLWFAIENTLVKTINVAGKLRFSLNRSSPKTIGLENSTIPVSYTHLDVYKRQFLMFEVGGGLPVATLTTNGKMCCSVKWETVRYTYTIHILNLGCLVSTLRISYDGIQGATTHSVCMCEYFFQVTLPPHLSTPLLTRCD